MAHPSASSPASAQRRPISAGDLGFALFLLAALPFCLVDLVDLPTARVTLAPLFFLTATARWGMVRGAIAAFVLTAPTLWLWGVNPRPLIVVGQVIAYGLVRRHRRVTMTEVTAVYYFAVLPVLGVLLPPQGISISGLLLLQLEYLCLQLLWAAAADVLNENVVFDARFPFVGLRRPRSLDGVLRSATNLIVALLLQSALMQAIGTQISLEQRFHAQVRESALRLADVLNAHSPGKVDRLDRLGFADGERVTLYLSREQSGFAHRAGRALGAGCPQPITRQDDGSPASAGRIATSRCAILRLPAGAPPIGVAVFYERTPLDTFSWISVEFLVLAFAACVALLSRVAFTRELTRSLDQAMAMIMQFGKAGLAHEPVAGFREFARPLHAFVERNNQYVAAIAERERLARSVIELEGNLGLCILKDIHFDTATGHLRFTAQRMTAPPEPTEVAVHAADCALFTVARFSDEATIEYRIAGGDGIETFLVTLHDNVGECRWARGLVLRLRQPQRLREVISRQARLVDLGNMATIISHELKQPLFSIAIAAEQIHLLLERYKPDFAPQMERQASSIGAQVARTRDMIQHILRYSRADEAQAANIVDIVRTARSFLDPLLDEKAITVVERIGPGSHLIVAPYTALEQVVVNAIQNAVDAIQAAREEGRAAGTIWLTIETIAEGLSCAIADDGIGLGPGVGETAFTPFFTTKPSDKGTGLGLFISRQIILDSGGTIALSPHEPYGACLRVTLPTVSAVA